MRPSASFLVLVIPGERDLVQSWSILGDGVGIDPHNTDERLFAEDERFEIYASGQPKPTIGGTRGRKRVHAHLLSDNVAIKELPSRKS